MNNKSGVGERVKTIVREDDKNYQAEGVRVIEDDLDSPRVDEEEVEKADLVKTPKDDEQLFPSTPPNKKQKLKPNNIKKKTTRSPHLSTKTNPKPMWMTPASSTKKNQPGDKKTPSPQSAANKSVRYSQKMGKITFNLGSFSKVKMTRWER